MQVAVVLVALFALAQLIRPPHVNPPIDPGRTIGAHAGTPDGLAAIVDRACRDCHTNATVWPWYSNVAPLSWVVVAGVAKGRKAINFSEWASYPPARQHELLAAACRDVSAGTMPGSAWTKLHPETRLSPRDIEMFCAAAQQADSRASN